MRLSTLPAMREATQLYRSLGFREREAAGDSAGEGGLVFERPLRQKKR